MRKIRLIYLVTTLGAIDAQVEVAVHRGANRHAPENTLQAGKIAVVLDGDYLEIDVRENVEGIFFNFHDKTLDRTTDGSGAFFERTVSEIEDLDAGSWYRHGWKGTKVPTVEQIVKELKGEIKFYFDFKAGNLQKFVELIKDWGIAGDCFFNLKETDIPILDEEGLKFKVNVSNLGELMEAHTKWKPPIVEVRAQHLSKRLVDAAHDRGIKVMAYVPGDQVEAYKHCLRFDIDMINLDNPDLFKSLEDSNAMENTMWVAHRGGVVSDSITEYNPEGIQMLSDRNYYGAEVDIWETADGELIVHHNKNLKDVFGVDLNVASATLAELRSHVSLLGGYHLMTLSEYLNLLPEDFVIMADIKTNGRDRSAQFYANLKADISARHDFENCLFIDDEAREPYWGEARFGVRIKELPELYEQWRNGEDVACHFFLFDHGNRLSAEAVRLAQLMSLEVVPSVNTFHYRMENPILSGLRDIANLKKLGVRVFQIDSVYDSFLD